MEKFKDVQSDGMSDREEYDETSKLTDRSPDYYKSKLYNGARPKTKPSDISSIHHPHVHWTKRTNIRNKRSKFDSVNQTHLEQDANIRHQSDIQTRRKRNMHRGSKKDFNIHEGNKDKSNEDILQISMETSKEYIDDTLEDSRKTEYYKSNNKNEPTTWNAGEVGGCRAKCAVTVESERNLGQNSSGEEENPEHKLRKKVSREDRKNNFRQKDHAGYHKNKLRKKSGGNDRESRLRNESSVEDRVNTPRQQFNEEDQESKLMNNGSKFLSEEDRKTKIRAKTFGEDRGNKLRKKFSRDLEIKTSDESEIEDVLRNKSDGKNKGKKSRKKLFGEDQENKPCEKFRGEYHENTFRKKFGGEDQGPTSKRKVIGFPFLRNLIGKDSSFIVTELTKTLPSLKDCIIRTSKEEDFLEVFLQVVAEAFLSKSTPLLIIRLFDTLKENGFFDTIMKYLVDVMIKVNIANKDGQEIQKVLRNILTIIMEQTTRNPSSLSVFLRIYVLLGQVINVLVTHGNVDDDITVEYQHLTVKKNEIEEGQKQSSGQMNNKPLDDFRDYPVFPTPDEITGAVRPFLRPNKVEGEYDDLDHYLDIQYRLLREDFVGPLRDGMKEYINIMTTVKKRRNPGATPNLRNLDIKVYENVRVHSPVVTQKGLCYKLQLEMTDNLQRITWKFSKRLIYGSMVCLTDKNFNDFFLATVVEREEKDINNGFFIVHFEQEDLVVHQLLHKVFRMAETSGYFESYRHVLTSLQSFEEGDLPFKEYIIGCQRDVVPPRYLSTGQTYDLRPIVDQTVELHADRRLSRVSIGKTVKAKSELQFSQTSNVANAVPVLNHERWPSKEILHMDKSQYKAVQTALSNEFAIIQGPPGTGKTYIGLQIVKALLHNKSAWAGGSKDNRPMLIVCYTNHALDQFLEGIAKLFKGDVLRVGGRSSSDYLQQFNLREYREIHHGANTTLGKLQRSKRQAKRDLESLSELVQRLAICIQTYRTEIVKEDVLKPNIGERLYKNLTNGFRGKRNNENFSFIVKWLGIGHITKDCMKQAQNEEDGIHTKYVKVEDDATRKLRERMIDTGEKQGLTTDEQLMLQTLREEAVAFHVQIHDTAEQKKANKNTLATRYMKLLKSTIIRKISEEDIMSQEEANSITDLWSLNHKTKWRLYRLWIRKLCSNMYDKIERKRRDFEEASERYRETVEQEDKEIMRQALVIGMTTSGAARYQSVLRDIGPRIIVVEEAAEVLEAHIITTLSKGCEHLILIGDHKQLRPNPTVYKLAVKYNLDISLFERMVKNDMKFNCLELQHRMRPEISNVIRHIYPHLQDHEHVRSYPNVKGISTNMFLVNHAHFESSAHDIRSYSNKKEAEYAVALCRYLLLQGYGNHEITILTTYTGQLMCIRNMMPKDAFDGVKLTVVDNYQGEENEIIILSLVRSNAIGKIGFLSTENRICVALSRAKVGFYVLGNFDHLAAHSSLWKDIAEDIKEKGYFGEGLKLYCQNHPKDDAIVAKSHEDFKKAPEGGCTKICDARLKCGHKCERYCHVIDQKHERNKCQKSCTKTLCEFEHKCPDKCYMKCRPCMEPMPKKIPKCGHTQRVPCSIKPEAFRCIEPCNTILRCSHRCQNFCGDRHTTRCSEKIDFTWPCGHTGIIRCWEADSKPCPNPCGAVLKCGDICTATCGACLNGRVHHPCHHSCNRILICGHQCKNYCDNCPPCDEACGNRCVHSVCKKRCGEKCARCKEPCAWKCSHYKCTRLCSEPCNRPRCNKACKKSLKCKHQCIGLCGEPCPQLCRICDKEKVTEIFFGNEDNPNARFVLLEDCSHIVESRAMDKYMVEANDRGSIQLKCCPLCKTPIRKCLRYGKIINRILGDIERVKKDIIGNFRHYDTVKLHIDKLPIQNEEDSRIYRDIETRRINTERAKILHPRHYYKYICKEEFGRRLDELKKRRFYTERQLLTIQNQHSIATAIVDVRQKIMECGGSVKGSQPKAEQRLVLFLQDLLPNIMKPRDFLTEQEIEDFTYEIDRGKFYAKFLKLRTAIKSAGKDASAKTDAQKVESLILEEEKFTEEKRQQIDTSFERLTELVKIDGLAITEDERLDIVKAIGLTKGHWFKCPNNHVYAIGECGGATERGKCPECKADIGGLQHRLTDGNRLATEMDGAAYAAFSEEANNMANFDLNNLF